MRTYWARQPQLCVPCRGDVVSAFLPIGGVFGTFLGRASGPGALYPTDKGTHTIAVGPLGKYHSASNALDLMRSTNPYKWPDTRAPVTIVTHFTLAASRASAVSVFSGSNTGSNTQLLIATDGTITWSGLPGVGDGSLASAAGAVPPGAHTVALEAWSIGGTATRKMRMYCDGNLIAASDSVSLNSNSQTMEVALPKKYNTVGHGPATAMVWVAAVLDTLCARDISIYPWKVFAPVGLPTSWVSVVAQFLRPISDVSNSGWTPSSGSDLFPMIGEATRNDATYISATEPGAACEVLLGTSDGDPLSSVNHLPRIVMSAGSGGIIIRLKQGATLIKEWTYSSLTGTDTLYEPTLTGGEIDSITDYTDLRLYLETTA